LTSPALSALLPNLPPEQLEDLLLRVDRAQILGSLARGMSHDLRGPLQTLTLLADPHFDFQDPDDGSRLRTAVSDSVQKLTETVTRFSQIYASPEVDPAPVVIEELLTHLGEIQRYQRALPPVEVEIRFPGGLPAARGTDTALRHILLGLITNAKEAVEGRPDAAIILAAEPAPGGVTLLVEDNGPGIPSDIRARAFEPFFTTRPGHLGIGLWVARILAERNGGTLELEERPGGGTRARLAVPGWRRA
jgi:signal transduction histidine kinase